MTRLLENDTMRSLALFVSVFIIFSGFAVAQDTAPEPEDKPILNGETVEQTVEEAAKNTDLGDSVDDLLEGTLKAGEDAPAAPEAESGQAPAPPEPITQETLDGLDAQTGAVERAQSLGAGQTATAPIAGTVNAVTGEAEFPEAPLEEPEEPVKTFDKYESATLRALDKITGRSTDMDVELDDPIVFGSLNIRMKSCFQTPPELAPESAAFLDITSIKATQSEDEGSQAQAEGELGFDEEGRKRLFSGWMFASSPGLSALEHPVYDVWVISCKAS